MHFWWQDQDAAAVILSAVAETPRPPPHRITLDNGRYAEGAVVAWRAPAAPVAGTGRRPQFLVVGVPEGRPVTLDPLRWYPPRVPLAVGRRPQFQVVSADFDRQRAEKYLVVRWGGPASAGLRRVLGPQVHSAPEDPRAGQPFGFQNFGPPSRTAPVGAGRRPDFQIVFTEDLREQNLLLVSWGGPAGFVEEPPPAGGEARQRTLTGMGT